MTNLNQTYVYLGTIWEDQDRREVGRTATVVGVQDGYATVVTRKPGKTAGMSKIRLDRFGKAWKRCGFDSNVAPDLQGDLKRA